MKYAALCISAVLLAAPVVANPQNSRIGIARAVRAAPALPAVRHLNGPGVDEIDVITIAPSDPNVLFVGTFDAGLWKSVDAGATWKACNTRTAGIDFGPDVCDLAIDPFDPQIVYAAAGFVYKSIDGGASWVMVAAAHGSADVIVVALSDPETIYVGTCGQGTFKSSDGGKDWYPIKSGLRSGCVTGIAVDPTNASVAYAECEDVFKTTDGGASWVSTNFPDFGESDLVIDPANPSTLYALGDRGIYKSSDAGATWNTSYQITAWGISGLAIDPTNPAILYAGDWSSGFHETLDGGATWSSAGSGIQNPEVQIMAVSSSSPATVYAGTSDGLFTSTDRGLDWSPIGQGLPPAKVNSIVSSAANPKIMYTITGSARVYASTDAGEHWTGSPMAPVFQIPFGIPIFAVLAITVDPTNPATAYVGTTRGVAKSIDGGVTWAALNPLTVTLGSTTAFAFETPDTLLAGTVYGVYKTSDGGATWADANNGLTTSSFESPWNASPFSALAVDPANPDIVYAGQGYPVPIYKTTNGGQSWSEASFGLGGRGGGSIAIDPSKPRVLYAGTGIGLYKSSDAGASWFPVSLGFSVSRVLINPIRNDTIYIVTNSGVLRSVDGGKRWTAISLPGVNLNVNSLAIDPSNAARILIATDCGVYEVVSPPPVLTSAAFDGARRLTISGTAFDQAPEVLINGSDRSRFIRSASGRVIILKGTAAALGLRPGANTIEIISCSGTASNAISLNL